MYELDKIYSSLDHFGLDEIDSKIYVGLLQLGPVTAGTISAKLDMDRGKVYRSLYKLRNLEVISTTFSNPTKVNAITPSKAWTNIIQRKEDEIISLHKLSKILVEELKCFERPTLPSNISSFAIIQGRTNIYSHIGKLIQESSGPIYIVSTVRDILQMYYTAITEKIKLCINNGGEIRLIIDQCNENELPLIQRLGVTEIRIAKLPSKGRIITSKEGPLIMSGVTTESGNSNESKDTILSTDSLEITSNMYALCTLLWKKAKPLEVCVIKIE